LSIDPDIYKPYIKLKKTHKIVL